MKDFLQWFKNSTKIKRWVFLILIGMALTCYGFSEVIVLERLEISDLLRIVGTFVIGFSFFIIGLIYIQRRSLEIAIEHNTDDDKINFSNIKALVTHKNIYEKGPKVVVIGGGNRA